MFWGLNVVGGVLIHATPHYGELGRPASMGCIRQSLPDAMELFDLVANRHEGRKAAIQVHAMGSTGAVKRLRQLVYDPDYVPASGDQTLYANSTSARQITWVIDQLIQNEKNIKSVIKKRKTSEIYSGGHAWLDPTTQAEIPAVYPMCGPVDCVKTWGEPLKIYKRRKAQLATGL
jgi:hypothetical protein